MTCEVPTEAKESDRNPPMVIAISWEQYKEGKHIFGYLFSQEATQQMREWLKDHKEEVAKTKTGTKPPFKLDSISPNLKIDFPWAHSAIYPGITVYDEENELKHELILQAIESFGWDSDFKIIKVTRW